MSFSRAAVYLPTSLFFWLVSCFCLLVICVSYCVEQFLFLFFWAVVSLQTGMYSGAGGGDGSMFAGGGFMPSQSQANDFGGGGGRVRNAFLFS